MENRDKLIRGILREASSGYKLPTIDEKFNKWLSEVSPTIQTKVNGFMGSVDEMIKLEGEKLANLKLLRIGYMQKLIAGELKFKE